MLGRLFFRRCMAHWQRHFICVIHVMIRFRYHEGGMRRKEGQVHEPGIVSLCREMIDHRINEEGRIAVIRRIDRGGIGLALVFRSRIVCLGGEYRPGIFCYRVTFFL